jgi:hypothetical protein
MDVALAFVVPGLVGGLLLAALLVRLNRRPSSGLVRHSTLEAVSPDVINMAHIRVAGIGGLSMIAAGIIIAVNLPEIGLSLLTALSLGAALAVGMIVYRSRSTSAREGQNGGLPPSVLALDRDSKHVDDVRHPAAKNLCSAQ